MGSICHPAKQSLENYTKVNAEDGRKSQQFETIELTLQPLNKVFSDGLILFVDEQCSLIKNEYLTHIDKKIGIRLQQYLNIEMNQLKLCAGDSLIMNVNIEELPPTKIAILCVKVWEGDNKDQYRSLQLDIEATLDLLKKEGVTSVCITNFNSEFGIPVQFGNKTILKAVGSRINEFKKLIIASMGQDSKKSLVEAVSLVLLKGKTGQQQSEEESMQSVQSEYY